ncbi:hypothetical protein [Rhodanobacter sp. MP1X3]|uniref:hypothetical protein n=1 Tax=Rhodanobacter sp. MP1X3 TaxID=2723086 RepID=UPI0017F79126|nr:hypothetical protein [Rhodanobacter sp. MP1X3]MBB6244935.1 hypothetical protein [Rhodanobacter sp. MP1X3]
MRSKQFGVTACILLFALGIANALGASNVVVGVNVVGPDQLTAEQQAALIAELRSAKVKVIRTGLVNDKNVEFIIRAYQAGIGTVGLVLPEQIMAGKQKSPADRSIGRNWGVPALTRSWLSSQDDGFRSFVGKCVIQAASRHNLTGKETRMRFWIEMVSGRVHSKALLFASK